MAKDVTFPNGKVYKVSPLTFNKRNLALLGSLEQMERGELGDVVQFLTDAYDTIHSSLCKSHTPEEADEALDSVPLQMQSEQALREIFSAMLGVEIAAPTTATTNA